jgi:hypothetical protein
VWLLFGSRLNDRLKELVHARAEVCFAKMSSKKTKEKKKKKKKTALVICRDRRQFWTTQAQFWQWVRDGIVVRTGAREHEELMVLLSNTVLNLAHPNHMREALLSRRVGLAGK